MASLDNIGLDHLIGKDVGSSTLLEEIARGAMGAVFLGYQRTLKRQIAIKVLPKAIITDLTAKIFQQEAELAAKLSHPNIIPVYEVGDAGDFLYIAMQLVKGEPLSEYIHMAHKNLLPSKRTMPLDITFKFITCILDALEYAHQNSIVHRDIKPGNILVESDSNRPIIVDFGLAQAIQIPDETSSMIVGTPLYMAPEQIFSAQVDGRADIYASATMLYEMLTPVPLFQHIDSTDDILRFKMNKSNNLFIQMPSEINPELNREIDQILLKALAPEPEERYEKCCEFRNRLNQYYEQYHGKTG